MTLIPPRRIGNLLGFLICAGLLGFAYYAEYVMYLDPCPLCMVQRICVFLMGVTFLMAFIHGPGNKGARFYGVLTAIWGVLGALVAGRHLWLQSLPPDQVPECGPSLEYMLDVMSFTETLREVFTGSGECADVSWSLLGQSMPFWTLVAFIGLSLAALVLGFKKEHR